MTTIDEDKLAGALREAGGAFAVSPGATDRILAEALDAPDRAPRRVTGIVQRYGRGRSTLLAVAAGLVIVGITVPLLRGEVSTTKAPAALSAREQAVVHGSGFTSLSPATGDVVNGTGQTMAVTGTSANSKTVSNTVTSSLRVEETGSIDLSVGAGKFDATMTKLAGFATSDGGFVGATHEHMGTKASGTYSSGTIVLQVPERRFAQLVDQVRGAGHTTSVVTSANDVTGQYVDLQARITALEVSRAQYLKIMTRATTIGGILAVQGQLDSLQSQIEELQSQLNLLNSETTYATLTVSVAESGHHVVVHHAESGVAKAWHDAISGFVGGFEWLIRVSGPLLFALLCLCVLAVLGRLTWRATQRRRT